MKSVQIEVPQGYEIDQDKSTFTNIVFRPIKEKELPKTLGELETVKGWYVNTASDAIRSTESAANFINRNIFVTKEQAEAAVALAQLSQLRQIYRQGWKPDWKDNSLKYVINTYKEMFTVETYYHTRHFLAFQNAEVRDKFLENFKDLIETAAPLLFG
jgi:hypothetical protein